MGSEFKWIMGSIFSVVIFSAGLLIYGIIDSNTSHAPTASAGLLALPLLMTRRIFMSRTNA